MMVLAIGLAAALCVALGVWGLGLATAGERVVADALPARRGRKGSGDDTFIIAVLADAVGAPFTRPMMDILGPWRATIRRRIDAAGRPGGMTVEKYARRTAGYIVIFGTLAVIFFLNGSYLFGILMLLTAGLNEGMLWSKAR